MTIYIIAKGILSFNPKYIGFGDDGLGVELFNTIYIVLLTLIISTPLGICAGIYMAEYAKKGKLTSAIRICIETLSSLPSIVVGLFGFLVFVVLIHSTWNIIAGVLTLTILCIPLLTRTTEDGIRNIDDTYREASYALGTTKWQTITHVLLPTATPRIVTGVILAAGRCFGEAAALIYTAGMSSNVFFNDWNPNSSRSPLSLFRQADTLAVRIWYLKTAAIMPDKNEIADMAAAMLMILVFVFNLGSRFIGRSLEKRMFGKNK
jgi:phosphate transport system permease protein